MKKQNVLKKVKNPMEKFGMFGKEEGFTTIKELLWNYGNKCLGIEPAKKQQKGLKPAKAISGV